MANQIIKSIRKYVSIWQEAKERDLNEADIVTRVIKFFEDALGYDVLAHITKEFQVKDRYVDLAVKINGKVKFYVEAKAANVALKEGQIFQAESYASQSGVEWVVLTNGAEWQLYHLTFDKTGIEHTLVFHLDLINGDAAINADKLNCLSFDSVRKGELEDYWEKCLSLHATSMIKALFHEDTLSSIRRQIRRKTDIMLDEDEVMEGLKKLMNLEILSQFGDIIRIGRRKKASRKDESDAQTEEKQETIETNAVLSQNITEQNKTIEVKIEPTAESRRTEQAS